MKSTNQNQSILDDLLNKLNQDVKESKTLPTEIKDLIAHSMDLLKIHKTLLKDAKPILKEYDQQVIKTDLNPSKFNKDELTLISAKMIAISNEIGENQLKIDNNHRLMNKLTSTMDE